MSLNVFRVLGDVSHTVSKCILIWSIHSNRSAEGVSLISQMLYIGVFATRYIDLFWTNPFGRFLRFWNFSLKIFYILTSIYIVFLMLKVFARTREREKAWRMGLYSLVASLLAAFPVTFVFEGWQGPFEVLYTFSLILESVCILPQLLLLRQTSVPTVIDSFYLVTLGSYRFFYILNWIVRGVSHDSVSPISIIFGVIQTCLYFDFAWVYWSRQRVKLRYGGVVDQEDFSRSWLVGRLTGNGRAGAEEHEDEEDERFIGQEEGVIRPPGPKHGNSWGARGISVSADDTLHEHDNARSSAGGLAAPEAFEDDIEEDAVVVSPDVGAQHAEEEEFLGDLGDQAGVSNGAEWRDDHAQA